MGRPLRCAARGIAPPLAAFAILLLGATPVRAGSHLWRFSEFYSSPDHSVQFIEMQEIGGQDHEINISEHWYATNGYNQDHSELLGTDLPDGTANKKFLVATASYAALPGVPAPDYVLPDGFLNPEDGDLVLWWFYQALELQPGQVPVDGVTSLNVDNPGGEPNLAFSIATNSPTNFAGETGTVVLPGAVPSLSPWGAVAGALALLGAAWASTRRREVR